MPVITWVGLSSTLGHTSSYNDWKVRVLPKWPSLNSHQSLVRTLESFKLVMIADTIDPDNNSQSWKCPDSHVSMSPFKPHQRNLKRSCKLLTWSIGSERMKVDWKDGLTEKTKRYKEGVLEGGFQKSFRRIGPRKDRRATAIVESTKFSHYNLQYMDEWKKYT